MATGEAEYAAPSVERLAFFSDAVIAIAITLLAIDLPVPTGTSVSAFWSSVHQNKGHYVAFLISFAVIAAAWSHHHDLFRYATDMDSGLRQVNMAWLLTIVLIPFATRLLTARAYESLDVHALRFGFYALLQALVVRVAAGDAASPASTQTGAGHARADRSESELAVLRPGPWLRLFAVALVPARTRSA